MVQATELTIEQKFKLKLFADQVQHMSREQAQVFLIEQYKLTMLQQITYQELLKHEWKLDSNADSL